MLEVIAVDTGNKNIKTVNCEPFNAGLIRHGSERPALRVDTLCIGGQYYSLTESREPHRENKTETDTYYLLTLMAVARELEYRHGAREFYKFDIALALGLPPSDVASLHSAYEQYFSKGGKMVNFTFNGHPFELTIPKVYVFAQGFAAVANIQKTLAAHARSYVIDIGGYTTDVIQLNSGRPDMEFCDSFQMGAIQLFDRVSRKIRSRCRLDVDDYMVDAMLRGTAEVDGTVLEVAKEASREYASQLIHKLLEKGVDLTLSFPVFVGGGALLMKDVLQESCQCKESLCLNNVSANAAGYEYLAKAMQLNTMRMAAAGA